MIAIDTNTLFRLSMLWVAGIGEYVAYLRLVTTINIPESFQSIWFTIADLASGFIEIERSKTWSEVIKIEFATSFHRNKEGFDAFLIVFSLKCISIRFIEGKSTVSWINKIDTCYRIGVVLCCGQLCAAHCTVHVRIVLKKLNNILQHFGVFHSEIALINENRNKQSFKIRETPCVCFLWPSGQLPLPILCSLSKCSWNQQKIRATLHTW